MPIYEYLCKACGHQLEAIQGFNDEPLKKCPECHASKLEKQISKPSFHLKGTGWYVTDFKDGQKEKKSKEVKEDKSATDSTKEEKSKEEKNSSTEDKKVKPEKTKSEAKE